MNRANIRFTPRPSSVPALQGARSNAERHRVRDPPGAFPLGHPPIGLRLWHTVADATTVLRSSGTFAFLYLLKGSIKANKMQSAGALWLSC